MHRQFDDVLLGSIELFCLAGELGSFTAAATVAGVTPAAVSRSVGRLEERMGVRLFVRTTRQIRLTDVGRAYFEQCQHALAQLIEAERMATGQQLHAVGTLRISVPTTYAHYRLLPWLPEFRELHPEVRLDIHISNRNIDFSEERFDVAIRVREPSDSRLIARHLEDAELVVVAAPEYLARRGTPATLEDLRQHECIQFDLPSSGRRIPWLFKSQGKEMELNCDGGFALSEDVLGGVTLARHGAGLFQTYRFIVESDLREGRLVAVLHEFGGASRPYSLLYPHNRHVPLRVRSFIDFLVKKVA